MRSWATIEELAADMGISERTGWRWLRKGKVRKEISENGEGVFVLSDNTDTDRDDNVTVTWQGDRNKDVIEERGDRKKYRPSKVSFASIEPSPAVISQAERTQIAELQAEEEEALERRKGRNKEHPLVTEMRARVESKKLNLELQNLIQQENEQLRDGYQRKMIETVKVTVIPSKLRAQLPSDILLVSLRLIDEGLKNVAGYTLDECIALAKSIVYMKYWGADPTIYRIIRPAIIRWMFTELEHNLEAEYKSMVMDGYEGTYNDFLAQIFSYMSPSEQAEIISFGRKN
jgi:hypothetical protein